MKRLGYEVILFQILLRLQQVKHSKLKIRKLMCTISIRSTNSCLMLICSLDVDVGVPIFGDCFELYHNGFITEGVYEIDVSGNRDPTNTIAVYCNMGWTFLLNRGQYGNSKVIYNNCT